MNEYEEAFNELKDKDTFRGQQWFGQRKKLVEKYAWAVPNEEALLYLAEFDSITEVGAGSGYWANCIEDAGGSVRATDIDPPDETWTEVEEAGVDDLDLSDEVVLSVWPPYGHPKVAEKILHQKPPHIVYVGEPRGGCTGSDAFFDTVERKYGLVAKVDIPSYVGIHDDLFHYIRKL